MYSEDKSNGITALESRNVYHLLCIIQEKVNNAYWSETVEVGWNLIYIGEQLYLHYVVCYCKSQRRS